MSATAARGPFKLLAWLIALCLAAMVVLVFGNVVMRYAFNSGITLSEELARWLFVWLTFLGALIALKENEHLGTDMLVSRVGPRVRRALLLVAQALMFYSCWLLGQGSWAQVRINADVQAPVSGLPVALFYGAGLVFAVGAGAILLWQMLRLLRGQVADDALVMVQESEELAAVQALHLDDTPPLGQGPHSMPFKR
ncbi:MAG: C4-dicarboxylate ABC transporter permease [Burkholderiales bacterium PBB5]|nr:MAG: C4-dicarboxylate ABC transporter permease [Burkholderiales bacterium PBB5]